MVLWPEVRKMLLKFLIYKDNKMYQYISKDFSGNIKGVLTEAFDKEFTFYESEPGQLVFTLPLKSDLANENIIGKNKNIIEVYDGANLIWAGIVSDYQGTEDTITVTCDSFLYLLEYYFVKKSNTNGNYKDYYNSNSARNNNSWSATPINTIINTILTNAIGETNSLLGPNKCNITIGTIEAPTTPSTVSVMANFRTVLGFIEELYFMANEGDDVPLFEITPSRVFNFWKNKNTDKSDVVFILGSNMLQIDWAEIASDIANHVFGVGSGFWENQTGTEYSDATSKSDYGAMYDVSVRKDINNTTELLSTLKDFIKRYKNPTKLYTFSVKTDLFDGWNIGDNVRVIAKNGLLDIDEFRRVVAVGVSDREKVEVQIITEKKL